MTILCRIGLSFANASVRKLWSREKLFYESDAGLGLQDLPAVALVESTLADAAMGPAAGGLQFIWAHGMPPMEQMAQTVLLLKKGIGLKRGREKYIPL